jgi:hypothetical protein
VHRMRTSPLNHETTSAPAKHRRAFCVEPLARAWVESLPRDGVTVPVLVSFTPEVLVALVTRAITSRLTLDEVIHAAVSNDLKRTPDCCRECGDGHVEIGLLDTGKWIWGIPVQCLGCANDLPRHVAVKSLAVPLPQMDDQESTPPVVTRKQLAALYQVSIRTVDRWRKARRISYKKFGRLLRFDLAVVDAELSGYAIKCKNAGPSTPPLSVALKSLIDLTSKH